jgi:hypothetical protein
LNPTFVETNGVSRWTLVANELGQSETQVKEFLVANDPTGVIIQIKKYLEQHKDLETSFVYIGGTHFEDETIRKKQHERIHGQIEHKTLKTFDTRHEGLLAEALGIHFLTANKDLFKGILNQSLGFEAKTKNICDTKQNVYIYTTKTPYSKQVGPTTLQPKSTMTEESGEVHCLTCNSFYKERAFFRHVHSHFKDTFMCDGCDEKFASKESLDAHIIRSHNIIIKCFKLGCNWMGTMKQFSFTHFNECFAELMEDDNDLAKKIIENPTYSQRFRRKKEK